MVNIKSIVKVFFVLQFMLFSLNAFSQQRNRSFGYINPVITGMNPDPSVCRVGEDYYAVTSSFTWFPGVPVYHSKDLIHWEMIGYCLNRKSQLNFNDGPGIFAPTIRYQQGTFYMVTTNQRNGGNFYVTAKNPAGPWSQPIWVNEQAGIDPSLFFDDDGKVYFTSTDVGGITQSEINIKTGKLLTKPQVIWAGTGARYPEGPHLYRINKVYYLLISEGGTEYGHQLVIARSNSPWGPFESNPNNPILTHRNKNAQSNVIQGVGHADLVQATDNSWWAVFLGFRQRNSHHHIGRETLLAPVSWQATGWPLINKTGTVDLNMNVVTLPQKLFEAEKPLYTFDEKAMPLAWNYIKNPDSAAYSLTDKKGWLRLSCSLGNLNEGYPVTFTGRRQADLAFTAGTLLDFNPETDNTEAGLSIYHRAEGHYNVFVRKENNERCIVLRYTLGRIKHEQIKVKLTHGGVFIKVDGTAGLYTFSFSQDNASYNTLGIIETKFISSETLGGFTGAFIGLYATGNGKETADKAYFKWFEYKGLDN